MAEEEIVICYENSKISVVHLVIVDGYRGIATLLVVHMRDRGKNSVPSYV